MSVLKQGELRQLLERDLPGAIAPPDLHVQRTSNAAAEDQQRTQDDEAATSADTANAQTTEQATAKQAALVQAHDKEADTLQLFDNDAVVHAERLPDVMRYVRDALGYQFLSHITAVDYYAYGIIEVLYMVYRIDGGTGQTVRVRVPRDNPVIPSISPIWPGANLQEREAWDLFGVQFPGHPYHRRIYMWEEFEGHPMRKDFQKIGDTYFHFQWKGEGGGEE